MLFETAKYPTMKPFPDKFQVYFVLICNSFDTWDLRTCSLKLEWNWVPQFYFSMFPWHLFPQIVTLELFLGHAQFPHVNVLSGRLWLFSPGTGNFVLCSPRILSPLPWPRSLTHDSIRYSSNSSKYQTMKHLYFLYCQTEPPISNFQSCLDIKHIPGVYAVETILRTQCNHKTPRI